MKRHSPRCLPLGAVLSPSITAKKQYIALTALCLCSFAQAHAGIVVTLAGTIQMTNTPGAAPVSITESGNVATIHFGPSDEGNFMGPLVVSSSTVFGIINVGDQFAVTEDVSFTRSGENAMFVSGGLGLSDLTLTQDTAGTGFFFLELPHLISAIFTPNSFDLRASGTGLLNIGDGDVSGENNATVFMRGTGENFTYTSVLATVTVPDRGSSIVLLSVGLLAIGATRAKDKYAHRLTVR